MDGMRIFDYVAVHSSYKRNVNILLLYCKLEHDHTYTMY